MPIKKHLHCSLFRMTVVASSAAAVFGLAACTESGDSDVTASDVKNQAAETVKTTQEFAQDQVESYKESLLESVNVVDAEIEMLQSRANALSGDAKQEIEQVIKDLKTRKSEFVQRVENAKADSQAAWTDLKAGLDSAWDELKTSAEEASGRFGG